MSKPNKPDKPSENWPLYAHSNGQWAFERLGQPWYCGVWEEPQAALVRYGEIVAAIARGDDPRAIPRNASGYLTVKKLCELYMDYQEERLDAGEIGAAHLSDVHRTLKRVCELLGPRAANQLQPADWGNLKAHLQNRRRKDGSISKIGPNRLHAEIRRTRAAFNWAAKEGEISPPRYGARFTPPPKRLQRTAKAATQRHFSATEIRTLLSQADELMTAAILLGINAAFQPDDLYHVPMNLIDLEGGWHHYPRKKTGIGRLASLWPETIDAIQAYMEVRPEAASPEAEPLLFRRPTGEPWLDNRQFAHAFKELCEDAGVYVKRRGHAALRHTFQTVAEQRESNMLAIRGVMGHADPTIADPYREGWFARRIIDVCDHVREWLYSANSEEIISIRKPHESKKNAPSSESE